MNHPDENAALGVCGLCGRNPQELEQTIERLRKVLKKLSDDPRIMQEGGVDDADRALRIMNKLQAEVDVAQGVACSYFDPLGSDAAIMIQRHPWLDED